MVSEKDIKKHLVKNNVQCPVCNKIIFPENCGNVIYIKSSRGKVSVIHYKCFKKEGRK